MSVLNPANERDVAAQVKEARARKTPLDITGGGTKRRIGRPMQTAQEMSMRGLSGITLYEPAEMVIGAQAGTPLTAVEKTLAEKGQRLPFEPLDYRRLMASTGEPTIGAVAACNLSGPRRIQAGAARDSLIGVRFVNGAGDIIKNGGRVMKNVTGLDLVKLSAGAWGTLGVLTEVIFKVLPQPETQMTLALHGLEDAQAVEALAAALGSPFEPTAAAHLPAGLDGAARTLLRLEGFADSLAYRSGELQTLLARFGALEKIGEEVSQALWQRVRDADYFSAPQTGAVWRISVAPMRGPQVAAHIRAHLAIRYFYDWGGGLIWLAAEEKGDAGAAIIREAIASHGSGHATLVRAAPNVRAAVSVFQPLSAPLTALHKGLKASFDPDGMLNPGRMHAEF
ncbi:MAG: glycolate oxidase subunit GlcE [Beijerinckiaceae bacterium]